MGGAFWRKGAGDTDREEEGRPLPQTPGGRMWEVVTSFFFRLLGANLLCVFCCLPVITIPASLCGLHAVIQQYYRRKPGSVAETFFQEFRTDFFPRIGVTAAALTPAAVGLFLTGWLNSPLSYLFCAVLTVGSLLMFSWLFPQMALLNLNPGQALRNAALLMMIETKKNFFLLLLQVIPLTLLLLFWPISLLPAIFVMPIVPTLLGSVIVLPVLEQRLITEGDTGENRP